MSSPDPIWLCDRVATFRAFGAIESDVVHLAENLVVLEETRGMTIEGGVAHWASKTLRMPTFITNLNIFEWRTCHLFLLSLTFSSHWSWMVCPHPWQALSTKPPSSLIRIVLGSGLSCSWILWECGWWWNSGFVSSTSSFTLATLVAISTVIFTKSLYQDSIST